MITQEARAQEVVPAKVNKCVDIRLQTSGLSIMSIITIITIKPLVYLHHSSEDIYQHTGKCDIYQVC
jgi:hypothetical protein